MFQFSDCTVGGVDGSCRRIVGEMLENVPLNLIKIGKKDHLHVQIYYHFQCVST